eukprot:COSAG02_NODE_6970_length_3258_cov_2.502691_3_plen_258_part_00
MLGVTPLQPGFGSFVVLPHVAGSTLSTVNGTQPTPHGPITVSARRNDAHGSIVIEVNSPVAGFAGLRLLDEATDCILDTASVVIQAAVGSDGAHSDTVNMISKGKAAVLLDASNVPRLELSRIHPRMQAAHVYIALPAGRHKIAATFRSDCFATMATDSSPSSTAPTPAPTPVPTSTSGRALPTIPPFAKPSYPGSWTLDPSTGGSWRGKYGKAGYSLLAFDEGKDVAQLPKWVHGEYNTKPNGVWSCASHLRACTS